MWVIRFVYEEILINAFQEKYPSTHCIFHWVFSSKYKADSILKFCRFPIGINIHHFPAPWIIVKQNADMHHKHVLKKRRENGSGVGALSVLGKYAPPVWLQAAASLMDFFRYTGISILTSHDEYGLSIVEVFRQMFLSTNKLKTIKMLQVCFDCCACCNNVGETCFSMKVKKQQLSSCTWNTEPTQVLCKVVWAGCSCSVKNIRYGQIWTRDFKGALLFKSYKT